jgi:hypothetical protein
MAADAVVVTVGDPLLLGENTLDDGGGGDIELAMAGTVGFLRLEFRSMESSVSTLFTQGFYG